MMPHDDHPPSAAETARTPDAGRPFATLPDDPAIPALSALRDGLATEGLVPWAHLDDVRLLKHHPGSRCSLMVTCGADRFVIKAFRRRVRRQVELLAALAEAGRAEPGRPRVPRLVAHDLDLRAYSTEWLDGPTLNRVLIAGDGPRPGLLAARWLIDVHPLPFGGDGRPADGSPLDDLDAWTEIITRGDHRLGRRAAKLGERLLRQGTPAGTPGLLHGSYSVTSIIDCPGGPGVVDWDGFGRGAMEQDAGEFLATVTRVALHHPPAHRPAGLARQTFLSELAGHVDPDAVSWFETASLIKNARHASRARRAGWHARATRLLDLAERL